MFEEANRTLDIGFQKRFQNAFYLRLPTLSPAGKGNNKNRTYPVAPLSVYRSCITDSALQLCWFCHKGSTGWVTQLRIFMPALKANNPVSIAVGLVMPDRRCPSEAYTDTASHTMLSKTNPEGKGYRTKRAYLHGLHILYRVTNERICCSGAARCAGCVSRVLGNSIHRIVALAINRVTNRLC